MAGTFTTKYKDLAPASEDVWIESGTWGGAGVGYALSYGFKELHTIEVCPITFNNLTKSNPELCENQKVTRYLGSSRDLLKPIIEKVLDRDVVFWLDGHYSADDRQQRDPVSECPALSELEAIAAAPWKKSVLVCMDDAYLCDDAYWVTGSLRTTFKASDWPRTQQFAALMQGWQTHREDDILYFWRDFR